MWKLGQNVEAEIQTFTSSSLTKDRFQTSIGIQPGCCTVRLHQSFKLEEIISQPPILYLSYSSE